MAYRDFLRSRVDLVLRTSEIESRASGLAVGKLELWPPGSARGHDVIRLIEKSGLDVVILRGGAEDVQLAAALNTEDFISWQADTLLYFTIRAETLAAGSMPDALVRMSSGNESDVELLVKRIFAGYKNHYSATPALNKIDVVTAYQDWVCTALDKTGIKVFKALNSNQAPSGLCMTEVDHESFDEILLAGIVPEERGKGNYPQMIKMVGARALEAGKELVVISTQAANTPAIRAWCRLGFLPTITLNTFHVLRRDFHLSTLERSAITT